MTPAPFAAACLAAALACVAPPDPAPPALPADLVALHRELSSHFAVDPAGDPRVVDLGDPASVRRSPGFQDLKRLPAARRRELLATPGTGLLGFASLLSLTDERPDRAFALGLHYLVAGEPNFRLWDPAEVLLREAGSAGGKDARRRRRAALVEVLAPVPDGRRRSRLIITLDVVDPAALADVLRPDAPLLPASSTAIVAAAVLAKPDLLARPGGDRFGAGPVDPADLELARATLEELRAVPGVPAALWLSAADRTGEVPEAELIAALSAALLSDAITDVEMQAAFGQYKSLVRPVLDRTAGDDTRAARRRTILEGWIAPK